MWEPTLDSSTHIGVRKGFYKFAQYLAEVEDYTGSIAAFEKAGAKGTEIPRMLYKANKIQELQKYVDGKDEAVCIRLLRKKE
jgi:hypothetical protein